MQRMTERSTKASQDRSYDRIRESAVDLFASKGYVATGIRDIARAAGTTSSTLYHHVSNKEELLVAIMRDAFETLVERATAAVQEHSTPEAKLSALVRQHVQFEISEQQLGKVVTVEFRFLGSQARDEVVPLRDAYERVWDDVISEGIRTRAFKVQDRSLARLGVLHMCAGPGRWHWPEMPSSPEELADKIAAMALNVMRAGRPQ